MHFLALMRDPWWGLKEEKLLTFEVVLGSFLSPPSLGARRYPEKWRCSKALRAAGFSFREVFEYLIFVRHFGNVLQRE